MYQEFPYRVLETDQKKGHVDRPNIMVLRTRRVTRHHQHGADVFFSSVERSMLRAKRRKPRQPQTAEEGHSFPFIFTLMTSKSQKLYDLAMQKVKELIPNLNPEQAMGDFESSFG
ncbi:uncharacterized protein LOC127003896 [Eriocheir sinensis]|uniref:uncharacterized protein LOC127003896 n=1 Tax=Eriocheir sinensis TaxID=95602 RepID=UPI0021C8F1C8|nr:uncharacterized protein LOC127003896 [Eriocheir sinensis]